MDVCQLCSAPKDDHEGRHHPFVPPGVDAGAFISNSKDARRQRDAAANGQDQPSPAPTAVGRGLGGDPALRLALVNAGVITHAQLLAAEQEIADARASGRPAVAASSGAADPEGSFALGGSRP